MAGDVKIGGGHSSYVYACVGEPPNQNPTNPMKSTAVFDDSSPTPIRVFRCPKGARTWKDGTQIDQLTEAQLGAGEFYLIHWD
jgi:hypothetical protein